MTIEQTATLSAEPSVLPTKEVITAGERRIEFHRVEGLENIASVIGGTEHLVCFDVNDNRIQPSNYNKADGAPLRMLDSPAAKVDVSKRSVEDMGFWHRSADFSEVIICIKGALRWETELGTHVLTAGKVLSIPRGVAHRSALCEESGDENILIEVKISGDLTYTGPEQP
ncbi:hypothetical protein [Arthrobacter pascens]|uniref:hypothetical protein n=1 Tax=Arthrobacter pascens TaxID=1677 RepID=UPI00196A83C2|nr:hypothetical protein [Arthrobacter pascens]MBN3499712.1 hypothetical protein [Arthrobacter pascens]